MRHGREEATDPMAAATEELMSSGLAAIDISVFRGEGQVEAEAGWGPEKTEGNLRYILVTPQPPCAADEEEEQPPSPPEEVYREEDRITRYREMWESRFAGKCGSFDDQTSLGPMRFTFRPIPQYAKPHCTVQIFGIRVADLEDGLEWPLHVHGLVAARDNADHNRNFLFSRTRENCQILTQQDPCLLLTGPSRAIVIVDPITIEFQLKLKSKTDPEEDELLALATFNYPQTYLATSVVRSSILCRRCTIELAYAPLAPSVEATVVGVRVVGGAWPEGLRGRVVARVTTVKGGEVLLLDSLDGEMPINPSTGAVELSRRVVSVDLRGGKLVMSVVASSQTGGKEDEGGDDGADGVVVRGEVIFVPKRDGMSNGTCDLGLCKVEVTVAWSLVSTLVSEWRAAAKLRAKEEKP